MKIKVLGFAVGLLLLTNLITGWMLRSFQQERKKQLQDDAVMTIGQINEAVEELQPLARVESPEDRYRVASATQKRCAA